MKKIQGLQAPMELHQVDCLTNDGEKDLEACLEYLERLKETYEGEDIIEALKEDIPPEKPKLELKTLRT